MAGQSRDIARFTDARLIGRGGFGSVYQATDHEHGREVAIKVLQGTLGETERRRFDRERQTMGRLGSHPNIMPVHESGYTDEGEGYLVMELAPGGSLGDWLENHNTLPWENAVSVMASIADATQAAHDQGVLHRDIKPDNILIDAYNNPRLTDFGIAAVASNATATTSMTATLAHAAPEVLQGMTNTEAVDIYAIGSTLHNLIAGSAPFERADDVGVTAMMARALTEPPPSLVPYGVPEAVAQVVQRALAKEPTGRQAKASQLAQELRVAAAGGSPPAVPLPPSDDVSIDPSSAQTMLAQPSASDVANAGGVTNVGHVANAGGVMGQGPASGAEGETVTMGSSTPDPTPSPYPAPQHASFAPAETQKRSRGALIAAGVVVLVLLVAGGALAASQGVFGGGSNTEAIGDSGPGGDTDTEDETTSTASSTTVTTASTSSTTTPTSTTTSSTAPTTSAASTTATTATTVDTCQTVVQARTSKFNVEICAFSSGALTYIGSSRTSSDNIRLAACHQGNGVFLATNEAHEYYVDLSSQKLRVYDPDGVLIVNQELLDPITSDLSGPLQSCS
ncbi:MAG: protein kinase [Actinomycetia bacterium]|nr:protein kinase [Actinomycetes bacterium]